MGEGDVGTKAYLELRCIGGVCTPKPPKVKKGPSTKKNKKGGRNLGGGLPRGFSTPRFHYIF